MSTATNTSIPLRIFRSLVTTDHRRPWTLTRTLKSENPADIQGQLVGVARFELKKKSVMNTGVEMDMLYTEEGEMASGGMAGVRWSKKYIWRFTPTQDHDQDQNQEQENGTLSVWFVKPTTDDEPDYLFHELDLNPEPDTNPDPEAKLSPPAVPDTPESRVLVTRGEHLCVKDMYNTTYAFRVDLAGEVVSWMSRHVVRGPMKGQDIVNVYTR